MDRAFSPLIYRLIGPQGVALGWYSGAPLALIHAIALDRELSLELE